jgi:hypothetical protein
MNADATNALPLLRHLVQTPVALLSVENLRFEPFWDPIRNDPRFQALIQGAAP